ncbi:MAG: ABC transporter permease [Bacteroidota bacterium]
MVTLVKVFIESCRQAWQSLVGNKLRSFLSLLGISIGIFCIIGVLSAVDSLEDNVRASFDKLGNDVIYVDQFSWAEDPGQNYWKWMRRPQPSYKDFKAIQTKVDAADYTSFFTVVGAKTAKYRSNSVEGGYIVGITTESDVLFGWEFEKGRYFTNSEISAGAPKVILGGVLAEELFGTIEPIGKKIKVGGRKLEVIGVLTQDGESLINVMDFDSGIIIGYELARKYANLKEGGTLKSAISVKAKAKVSPEDLKEEIRGVIRARRKLKPKEADDFSLNELSLLSNLLDGVFGVLNTAGWMIGGFALIVGMFSVANIMFVSVKERTGLIGVKKALGAKRYVILTEFLIESVILCIIGGLFGLGLIWLLLKGISSALDFALYLDIGNALFGMGVSILTGILAGVIPAIQAANMDPVVAMRG